MEKVKIALIGVGIIGEQHLETYAKIPEAEVVAICDINEERLNYIGDKFGIERRFTHIGKMLLEEDIQAVDVCLHNNMHTPVSEAVMRAGKDCYCEKPMSGSFADAKRMYEVMEETGLRVKNIRYYKSQPWGFTDNILAGYFCDLDGDATITMDQDELSVAEWEKRDEIDVQPEDLSLTNEMICRFISGNYPQ